LSGISPHERPNQSFDIRNIDIDSAIKKSRHHPSEILEKPPMKIFKTPSFNLDEGDSQFPSPGGLHTNKAANFIENCNIDEEKPNNINNIGVSKEITNRKNIKGIKVQISRAELTRILKKPATIQEEDGKYKEKQEFLDKILNLEKCIQRKNELLEENMRKIKEFHQNEEDLKLNFYKQSKESSNKIKALALEAESLKEKNCQISENLMETQRDLQTFKEVLMLKDQEIKRMVQNFEETQEENKRLMDLNRELVDGNQEQKDFFKDFHAFNMKIKTLYEENHWLREKIESLENEIMNLNSQKDFLYNLYENSKGELEIKEKKVRKINFFMSFLCFLEEGPRGCDSFLNWK